jgi:hypothetical protein
MPTKWYRTIAGITSHSLNLALLNVEYAVRGEPAVDHVQLKEGEGPSLTFYRVISSTIGNP